MFINNKHPHRRNRLDIKLWLMSQGIAQCELAKEAKVGRSFICLYLQGLRASRKVDSALKRLGCPNELLNLRVDA